MRLNQTVRKCRARRESCDARCSPASLAPRTTPSRSAWSFRSPVQQPPLADTRSPAPRSRSIESTNPAAFWENSSNSSPRTTRRPIRALCSPSPSSRRSRTSSPSSARSARRKITRWRNDILKTGKPVCFGGTDPRLTKMGNPWIIRFRPNDTYSGRVIASYGVETLGKKNWALVHSTDAFGTSGQQSAWPPRSISSAPRSPLIRAIPTRARISRRSCSPSNRRAPTSSAPISPSRTIRRFSRGSCDNWASRSPGSDRPRPSPPRR